MDNLWRHPVFAMQVLNAAVLLWVINRLDFVALTLLITLMYMAYLNWLHRPWLAYQRALFSRIRAICAQALHLSKLEEIESNDWEQLNGAQAFSYALSWVGLTMFCTFVWEGRYFGSLNIFTNFGYLYFAATSKYPQLREFTGRFNVALQMFAVVSFGATFGAESARRMIIIRIMVALSYLESVFELFFHIVLAPTVYLLYRFPSHPRLVWLPFIHFLITILPTEIVGIRLWLLRKFRETKHVTRNYYVAAVSMVAPLSVAVFSFAIKEVEKCETTNTDIPDMDTMFPALFFRSFPYIGLMMVVAWPLWARVVDGVANPTFIPRRETRSEVHFEFSLTSAVWISTLLVLTYDFALWPYVFWGFLLFVFVKRTGDEDLERVCFLIFQSIMFMHFAPVQSLLFHMLLCCSRLWTCFENRRFSEVLCEQVFIAALHCLKSDQRGRPFIVGIMGVGLIVTLALRIASENNRRFVESVRNADSFLDHAIKQKFSAISSAMQHVLEASGNELEISFIRLLTSAIHECQLGLAACHLSSSALKFEAGTFVATPGKLSSIVSVLREWNDENLFLYPIPIDGDDDAKAELDWDLLRSLVIDLTRNPSRCSQWDPHSKSKHSGALLRLLVKSSPSTIRIQVVSPTKHGQGRKQILLRSIRESVAKALGGKLGEDGVSLDFPNRHAKRSLFPHDIGYTDTKSISARFMREVQRAITPETRYRRLSQDELSQELSPRVYSLGLDVIKPNLSRASALSEPRVSQTTSSASSIESYSGSPIFSQQMFTGTPSSKTAARTLPRGLSIAVLDDNNLVRKSLNIVLKLHLGANMDTSFVIGATKDEALQFPQLILDKKMDVAIFDENLEYPDEEESIKGSVLAAKARQLGFKGCLVLHSANSALADNYDSCFDGFVEKTSSKEHFCKCLVRAYEASLNSKMH